MFKTFLVGLLKTAVSTDEFKATLTEGVRGAIASSRTAAGVSGAVNSLMAQDSPQIAAGLRLGAPYLTAVLDGIDPNEVATTSLSLIAMLKARAIQVAQEKGL